MIAIPFGSNSNASARRPWRARWVPLAALVAAGVESAARLPYKALERGAAPAPRLEHEAWVTTTDAADRIAWERALLRRIRAGDRAAFAELYRAYAPVLYRRVLLPKLGAPGAAEDALAETFRTAFLKLGDFQDQGVSVYHWLARIASNKAMDMHRVRARTERALTRLEGLTAPLEGPAAPDPFDDLSARRDQAQLATQVERALEALNPRYRRAIELRFLEERERQACADALEVKLGTFDVLLLRALRSFRKVWDEQGGAPAATPEGAPRHD